MNKMNEDEKKAIDMLEKYITEHKFYNIKQSDGLEDNIKILLDLYKEKNKSYNTAYSSGKAFENHRWKEKIREKIKEINNRRIEDGQCELALHGFQREAKIEVLNELLEEN